MAGRYVARVSHGAADTRCQPLKMLGNILQHTRHTGQGKTQLSI